MEIPEPRADELLPGRKFDGPERWTVLHVLSRQEKALMSDLERRRIEAFLPLIRKTRYYGRRKARVDVPLFPGYVFLWGTLDRAYEADRGGRVANLIPVTDQCQLEHDLCQIYRAVRVKDEHLDPCPRIENGTRVEVRSGPFRGVQGVVEHRNRIDRLVLQVGMLGSAVSLEVDGSLLEILN
jgi:transcriptional antiterminator RfaH